MAPFAGDEPGPERSLRFIHANRSKRSAVVDLETAEGRDIARALAERADILVGGPAARLPVAPRAGLRAA